MRPTEALRSPIRAGRRRSTSANVTSVTVSTRIWVRARSGAPLVANRATMPSPVTDTRTTPVYRFRAITAKTPAAAMIGATTSCAGVCHAESWRRSTSLAMRAVTSAATKTTKIVPTYTGSDPRWVKVVLSTESRSTPRTTR